MNEEELMTALNPEHRGRGISRSPGMMAILFGAILVLIAIAITFVVARAQTGMDQRPDRTIDAALRAEIIDSVTTAFNDVYVFPDVARKMEQHLRKQMKGGHYDTLTSLTAFAQVLTDDLRSVCNDRHVGIRFMPDEYFERIAADTLGDQEDPDELEHERYNNFGFHKVERLPGNIGYLDLRQFADAKYAGETAISAMKFLSNSSALIIDLRKNGGGSPSMIQLISSYFFDESEHLNSFYIRKEDTIKQFWTSAYVDGKKMVDIPIYVLTSQRTFSAAEEFTYNLKNMERATIIGETTGGGAHPVEGHVFPNLNIWMSVPFGRAINPITGTNWEGIGVTPHIQVPQDQALDVARLKAMKKLLEDADREEIKSALEWQIASFEALMNPHEIDDATMQSYAGVYGPRTIAFENGELYYQREERPKYKMIPMSDDLFMFEEIDYFRLKVIVDESGAPVELNGLYDNGHIDVSPRSK